MTSELAEKAELPYAFGGPAGTGRLRTEPEDFRVEEIPICEPDGTGEHVWLLVRKRNANTEWVARQLARLAEVTARDVSYAGLKDRRAVTEQWFSVQLPGRPDPDWQSVAIEGVDILQARRHSRKLKRGALRGNRFTIRIRAIDGSRAEFDARLTAIAQRGIPNYFGEQRFGRDGGNLAAADAMFKGRRVARHQRSLYLSAARSHLFNQVLAARVAADNWDRRLAGDVLQLDGSRALFSADDADPSLDQRLADLDIHPTGPLWGRGELPTSAAARALEQTSLMAFDSWREGLERAGLEQDRRALRVRVADLSWEWATDSELVLRFSLPSGSYATALLRELIVAETDEEMENS